MIILRDYQNEAVKGLIEKSNHLLSLTGNKKLVFKAPTGSGKTLIMAEYLTQLKEGRYGQDPIAYIWTAPRKLHEQSKEKLELYYRESRALKCSNFEDLQDKQIQAGEILFMNWESINKADNVYIRENEMDFNLSTVLDRTRDNGIEIVLIIDESHHTSNTENSQGLIEMINPKLTIDVSATPSVTGDENVTIQREDVVDAGMIKKSLSINPDFKNIVSSENSGKVKLVSTALKSTDEFVLAHAIQKREELESAFNEIGANVNPLLLIQLPDQRKTSIVDYQNTISQILNEKHNISIENGKLAIYLSENKENLENITKNDCGVEVMLFKQAIALGWDCPRASILALFRDWTDFTFSTQTLGRIMRMPELKHYQNEKLNIAFIYTTIGELTILEDLANEFITFQTSQRKEPYKTISLWSVHSKRFREETRLSPKFIEQFVKVSEDLKLAESINIEEVKINRKMLSDGEIKSSDFVIQSITEGEKKNGFSSDVVDRGLNDEEIQQLFDGFIIASLHPFYPEDRSVNRVKSAIYAFFKKRFNTQFEEFDTKIQKIVLNPENYQDFLNAINKTKEVYIEEVGKSKKGLSSIEEWEVPKSLSFNNKYIEISTTKCIMDKFFQEKNASQPEKGFKEFLENSKNVVWWFKNGERDATFFAVPYEVNGNQQPFYVDWVVMFSDGRIGLFDTKAGITASTIETKAKASGLYSYIQIENKKGKHLFGGIVVEKDGSWRYNENEKYYFNESDLSDWKML